MKKFVEQRHFGAFVVVYCIILPPIGLFFLWKHSRFSAAARWALTTWGILFSLFMILFLGVGLSGGQDPSPQTSSPAASAPSQPSTARAPAPSGPELPNLEVSLDTFVERFNAYQAYVGSPTVIGQYDLLIGDPQKGETQDVLSYQFNKRLALITSIRKDSGEIRDVTLILQDDGTESALEDIFGAVEGTVAAIRPDMPEQDRLDFVQSMGFDGGREWTKGLSLTRDGVVYTRQYQARIGLIFTAKSEDDR